MGVPRAGSARFVACTHARRHLGKVIRRLIDELGEGDRDSTVPVPVRKAFVQSGANPSAVLNEVAAVARRVIDGLQEGSRDSTVPASVRRPGKRDDVAGELGRSASAVIRRLIDGLLEGSLGARAQGPISQALVIAASGGTG